VCPGEENLAAKIVRELERRLARTFDVRVAIRKHVPHGGGLGGGSSDAAATLMALDRLCGLELSPRVLHETATAIGADVPFFLSPGPQFAMGRGQVLKQVALPEPLHVVIAVPDLSLATVQVYEWRDDDAQPALPAFMARAARLRAAIAGLREPRDLAALVENDLEPCVCSRHPAVAELEERLLEAGAYAAAMSGSGSCVFGLFADEAAALAARARRAPARTHYVTDLQARPQRRRPPTRQPGSGSK
jgi:4-diphosphocytidyl-2-C-methyl-D-erythritol kinase